MINTLCQHQIECVSTEIDETSHVERILHRRQVSKDQISNWELDSHLEYPEIERWLRFPNFTRADYAKLTKLGVHVLVSRYGSWLGITETGVLVEGCYRCDLLNMLFDVECSSEIMKLMGEMD